MLLLSTVTKYMLIIPNCNQIRTNQNPRVKFNVDQCPSWSCSPAPCGCINLADGRADFTAGRPEAVRQCGTDLDPDILQTWSMLSALHGNWSTARTLMIT